MITGTRGTLALGTLVLLALLSACAPAAPVDRLPDPTPIGPRATLSQTRAEDALPQADGQLAGWAIAAQSFDSASWDPFECAMDTDGVLAADTDLLTPVANARRDFARGDERVSVMIRSYRDQLGPEVLDDMAALRRGQCAAMTASLFFSLPFGDPITLTTDYSWTISDPLPYADGGRSFTAQAAGGGSFQQTAVVVSGANLVRVTFARPGVPDDDTTHEVLDQVMAGLTATTVDDG